MPHLIYNIIEDNSHKDNMIGKDIELAYGDINVNDGDSFEFPDIQIPDLKDNKSTSVTRNPDFSIEEDLDVQSNPPATTIKKVINKLILRISRCFFPNSQFIHLNQSLSIPIETIVNPSY